MSCSNKLTLIKCAIHTQADSTIIHSCLSTNKHSTELVCFELTLTSTVVCCGGLSKHRYNTDIETVYSHSRLSLYRLIRTL